MQLAPQFATLETAVTNPVPTRGEKTATNKQCESVGTGQLIGDQRRYHVVELPEIPGVACPCGTARRAFADVADFPATVHLTDISETARLHYHKRLTETYYIVSAEAGAYLELDGEHVPVR